MLHLVENVELNLFGRTGAHLPGGVRGGAGRASEAVYRAEAFLHPLI
jgi:hypothetical protein